jgi:NADH-quinone oxidoreductase subunit N
MFPPLEDLARLLPEMVASGFACLIMLLDPFVSKRQKGWMARLALVGALGSVAAVFVQARHLGAGFYGLLLVDEFSVFLHALVFGVAALAVLGAYDYLEREGIQFGEYYALVLFAATGMGIMAGANELMTAFVGLEISSIASYVLAGFRRNALKSNESAMKYFLLGSFATAFFLYGVALVYGATGTTGLQSLRLTAGDATGGSGALLVLGMGLMFVGLAFKVASAPFQLWTPDAYEGAPTPVTALFSSGPKAAAFALLVRVLFTAFGANSLSDLWFWAVWISAALTMFAGNLAALVQTNVKRMLAYSSIAHAGYILVAIAARNELGLAAVLFYLVTYSLVKIGAFTILAHLGDAGEKRLELAEYAGLGWKRPATAAFLSLFLLSLLGLPVTAGFLGKLFVFNSALAAANSAPALYPVLSSSLVWLAILLAVNSVIAAYYYLRVIVVMYFHEDAGDWKPAPMPAAVTAVVLITAAGTVYLGIFPGFVMQFATVAAAALR